MPNMVTCLWFDTQAEEAAAFYRSVFKDFHAGEVSHYGEVGQEIHGREAGTVMTVEFEILGQKFVGLNGGPAFTFNEAVSLMIDCADQAEVDYYWARLTEGGGQPGPCGWLKDRYGLSWQVVPTELERLLNDPDQGRAQRAMAAMLKMGKLDVAALRAAADGD